jgi:hypothetical protein
MAGLQGPPGIKGDRGMDGTKGEPVSKNLTVESACTGRFNFISR